MEFCKIAIKNSKDKGRGVFAEEMIDANTLIETAAVIVMSSADRTHLDKTLLHDYIFEWTPTDEKQCIMALGNVPIYNHSFASNAEYEMDYDAQTISVKSVRKIMKNEEITINYNGDWNDEKPLWFDVK